MKEVLHRIFPSLKRVVTQWIPSHCCIPGHEVAAKLAKKGRSLPQPDIEIFFDEEKRFIRSNFGNKWDSVQDIAG